MLMALKSLFFVNVYVYYISNPHTLFFYTIKRFSFCLVVVRQHVCSSKNISLSLKNELLSRNDRICK